MPKPKYILSDYLKRGLYRQITDTVNFPIYTKADCRKISELINQRKLSQVSESTLYRLFLSNSQNNVPYIHTLNILANFCGFTNWDKLEQDLNSLSNFEQSFGKIHNQNGTHKSLMTICIHRNELKPIYEFAEQFDQSLEIEKKFLLGAELFEGLKSNPNNNELFFKNLSQLPIIRESFFELMADPTFRIKDYETGIKCYLSNIKPEMSVQGLQDFLFGNSLLFRHYYITQRKTEAELLGKQLYIEYNFSLKELEKIHLFPRMRYLAYKLFHLSINESLKKAEQHEEWLLNYAKKISSYANSTEQSIVFYTLADAFCNHNYTSESRHETLKTIFKHILDSLPTSITTAPLKQALPYLDQNASSRWKLI